MSAQVAPRRPFKLALVALALLYVIFALGYPLAHAEEGRPITEEPPTVLKPVAPPFDIEGDSWKGGEVCVADPETESLTCYTDPAAYQADHPPRAGSLESCTGNGRHGVVLYDYFNAWGEFKYVNTLGNHQMGVYRDRLSSITNFTYCRVVLWDASPQRAVILPMRSGINITDWLVWWNNSTDVITVMP